MDYSETGHQIMCIFYLCEVAYNLVFTRINLRTSNLEIPPKWEPRWELLIDIGVISNCIFMGVVKKPRWKPLDKIRVINCCILFFFIGWGWRGRDRDR